MEWYFLPQSLDITALPSVPLAERLRLPLCAALYFVVDCQYRDTPILYIGRARTSLRARWSNHRIIDVLPSWARPHIAWLAVQPQDDLYMMEAEAIAFWDPPFNKVNPLRHLRDW